MLGLLAIACQPEITERPRTPEEKQAIRDRVAVLEAEALALDERQHLAAWRAQDTLELSEAPCPHGPELILGSGEQSATREGIHLLERTDLYTKRTFSGTGTATVRLGSLT